MKASEVRSPAGMRLSDRTKIDQLSRTFNELARGWAGTERECRQAAEFVDALDQLLVGIDEADAEELADMAWDELARLILVSVKQRGHLFDLYTRLEKLKEMERLRDEIPRLEGLKTDKSANAKALDELLGAKRAEMLKVEHLARINEEDVNAYVGESGFTRALRIASGIGIRAGGRATPAKTSVDTARQYRAEADALRNEIKALRDQLGRLSDETLDTDVSFRMARDHLSALEESRKEWDQDTPDQPDEPRRNEERKDNPGREIGPTVIGQRGGERTRPWSRQNNEP
jgi:NADH dehydrogenase/NADH:ubiquinone oxidoreductase subunit G